MKLASWFEPKYPRLPEEDPFRQSVDLWVKLAGDASHLTATLSGLEGMHEELLGRLHGHVKVASRKGHSLSEIATIWEQVAPDPIFVKTAFRALRTSLVDDDVFTPRGIIQSLQKTASVRAVNTDHPLVQDFISYCAVLEKTAQVRQERAEVVEAHEQMTEFLQKAAAGGLLGGVWSLGGKALGAAGKGGEAIGGVLLGKSMSPLSRSISKRLGQLGLVGGAAAVGTAAKREFDATVPGQTINRGIQAIKTVIPGTLENKHRQQELMYRIAQRQALARGEYG